MDTLRSVDMLCSSFDTFCNNVKIFSHRTISNTNSKVSILSVCLFFASLVLSVHGQHFMNVDVPVLNGTY